MRPPYRLDLTAIVLRRTSTNAVDVVASGVYRRALASPEGTVVVAVGQPAADRLAVELTGPRAAHADALASVRTMLGATVDVGAFLHRTRDVAWLWPLARRMRGVHPPRYPSLWEACANAVVFQQVSLHAASAIMARLVLALGAPADHDDVALRAFPAPAAVAGAADEVLRGAGLSAAKAASLRAIAAALASGALDGATLERLPTAQALESLRSLRGIGPWSAAIIALRGLGRLDVFPAGDSGAARSLALVAGDAAAATGDVLEALGDQRGMLYYHLLLARLEARGELPPAPRFE